MPGPAESAQWASATTLASHFAKHAPKLGLVDEQEYDQSARDTIRDGRRFAYWDSGGGHDRVGYYDRRAGLFTALTVDETLILTHFTADDSYIRGLDRRAIGGS